MDKLQVKKTMTDEKTHALSEVIQTASLEAAGAVRERAEEGHGIRA